MYRIGAIVGDVGSGKTALLTALLYSAHLEGKPIVANYGLEFPCLHLTFAQMAELPPTLQNAYIGADEMPIGANAYDFWKQTPRMILVLCNQIRKRNAVFLYTAQRFSRVTLAIREVTQVFFLPEDDDLLDVDHTILNEKGHPKNCAGQFHVEVLNQYLEQTGSFTFDSTKIRNLYNSNEIIEEKTAQPIVKPKPKAKS